MIQTKEDLKEYLKCDKEHLGIKYLRSKWNDEVWKFEIALRFHEYYYNNKRGLINNILCKYWAWRQHKLGVRLGFTIPVNTCGKGLRLSHYGSIIINGKAILGNFCDLHSCVLKTADIRSPKTGISVHFSYSLPMAMQIY